MSWRVVHVGNPAKLSVSRGQLFVEQEEKHSVPLEDIHTLVIDSHGVATSATALAQMSESGVNCIVCDEKHLPSGVLLPLNRHSRSHLIAERQLGLSLPTKKRVWQKVIQAKIANQAAVLRSIGSNTSLAPIAASVQSGDSTNREAYAARLYFSEMLQGKSRKDDDIYNALINFGYAIVRSSIARELAAYGFLPAFGIHHESELNNFNLADDFLEPFRPVIDLHAWKWMQTRTHGSGTDSLTPQDKAHMLNVLNERVCVNAESHGVRYAIELVVKSFSSVCESGDYAGIVLPTI